MRLTRRERRERRREDRRARRWAQGRRVLIILSAVVLVVALVFFLGTVAEERPVSRAGTPVVGPGLGDLAAPGGGEPAVVEVGLSPAERGPLRDRLARIARAHRGIYGVVILDPASGQSVSIDPDRRFTAASLNKLPVLLTLYRAAAAGTVDLEDPVTMLASDVQAYGTGSLQFEPVGTTMTLRECAGYLVRESDNTAWKMLDRHLGRDSIRSELYAAGATSTEYWMPNTTTPNDVLILLEKILDPSYTSPELSGEMLDLMTHTDFEDRLPGPLPESARVSHKIGSYGSTFGDAGVVFPKESRRPEDAYLIVVIASDTGEDTARAAMREMSLAAYQTLTSPGNPGEVGDDDPLR